MGVRIDDRLSALVTRRLGVEGVMLRSVDERSPAAAAGLRGTRQGRNGRLDPGDIIQEIDGKKVKSSDEYLGRLGVYRPGDVVTLGILRDGEPMKVKVKLEAAE
jgi:serine protease DegQ